MMKNRPMIHLHSNLERPTCAANSLLIEERRILHLHDEVMRMPRQEMRTS